MQNEFLEQGEVRSIQVRSGQKIRSRSGVLWLTLDGQSEDYFLRAGQIWVAPQAGMAVVQALRAGELEFTPSRRPNLATALKAAFSWRRGPKSQISATRPTKRRQPHCPA